MTAPPRAMSEDPQEKRGQRRNSDKVKVGTGDPCTRALERPRHPPHPESHVRGPLGEERDEERQ